MAILIFDKAKPFIEDYPFEFIQGLADSEGCPAISAKNYFHVSVIVAVSTNPSLLEYTQHILEKFKINAKFRLCNKKGQTDSIIDGRLITRTKDLYSLTISNKMGVSRFTDLIDFSIERKQRKLSDAIRLMTLPQKEARVLWKQKYEKIGREWKPINWLPPL